MRCKSGPSHALFFFSGEWTTAIYTLSLHDALPISWGVGLSHERSDIAGAESFHSLEGNMCDTAMRGADALPGSKATSRAKGSYRNLGDLVSGRRRRVRCEIGRASRTEREQIPGWDGPDTRK